MKGLIMKDLYNISYNMKYTILALIMWGIMFIPSAGVGGYIVMCAFLCSSMTNSTLAFDEQSGWSQYAMITPVTRREVVKGKYCILMITGIAGILFGLAAGTIGTVIAERLHVQAGDVWFEGDARQMLLAILLCAAIGMVLVMVSGSIVIAASFRYGVENGRLFQILAYLIPLGICYGVYQFLLKLGVEFTDKLVITVLGCGLLFALLLFCVMYQISCAIFSRKEL